MTSRFDPGQGRLVMSRGALRGLALVEAGLATDDEIGRELATAGIVKEGQIHEALTGLGRCVSRPLARLVVERLPRSTVQVEGWIDDRLAVLLRVPPQASEGDIVAVPRGMTAFRIARLTRLGPRSPHKVGGRVEIDAGLLEVLLLSGSSLEPDEVERLLPPDDALEPAWIETLAALSRAGATRWNAGVWWNAVDERPKARTLELVDSGIGIFLVTVAPRGKRAARRIELRPVTPSQTWQLLCALIPPPGEVSEPLGIE